MICSFSGPHDYLSNFYPADVEFDGKTYPTVEHAFQAAKTSDCVARARIGAAATPSAAKKLGRHVALRPDWEEAKVGIMLELVRRKFRHAELAERLLATGDEELVEGNSWGDRTWGAVWDGTRWDGRNELGCILMQIRSELRGVGASCSR